MATKRVKAPPRRVGPVFEDGSYRTQDGRTFDPELGRLRPTVKPKAKVKRKRTPGLSGERSGRWPT